jgi:hypothetical protein
MYTSYFLFEEWDRPSNLASLFSMLLRCFTRASMSRDRIWVSAAVTGWSVQLVRGERRETHTRDHNVMDILLWFDCRSSNLWISPCICGTISLWLKIEPERSWLFCHCPRSSTGIGQRGKCSCEYVMFFFFLGWAYIYRNEVIHYRHEKDMHFL